MNEKRKIVDYQEGDNGCRDSVYDHDIEDNGDDNDDVNDDDDDDNDDADDDDADDDEDGGDDDGDDEYGGCGARLKALDSTGNQNFIHQDTCSFIYHPIKLPPYKIHLVKM